MSKDTLAHIVCPCGKEYSGDRKQTEKLISLHQKYCEKGSVANTVTVVRSITLNTTNPKSHYGEKKKQQEIQRNLKDVVKECIAEGSVVIEKKKV